MGGLRQADADHAVGDPGRRARARRHPAVRRLLLEGLDPRRRARPRAAYGYCSSRSALVGTFLTGALHVPDVLHRLRRRAVRRSSRSTSHAPRRRPGRGRRCSCPSACSPLLAAIGGWIQFGRALGRRVTDWLDAGRRAARRGERRRRRRSRASLRRRARARPGIAVAWLRSTARSRRPAPEPCAAARAASSTSTSSTTRVFYRPAVALAKLLCARRRGAARRRLDREVVAGRRPRSARHGAQLQTGLVRTYALALAAGVAVLVVVFVAVQLTQSTAGSRRTPDPAAARRRRSSCWLAADAAASGPARSRSLRRAGRDRLLDRARSSRFDFAGGRALQLERAARRGSATSTSRTTSACSASRSGSSG